jgi:hypothetical protein
MLEGVSMAPSNKKAWYAQTLESVFLGALFLFCFFIAPKLINNEGIFARIALPFFSYLNTTTINLIATFFFIFVSFNSVFLKFRKKLFSIFLVSVFDLMLFFIWALFQFLYWGRWDWTRSLGSFSPYTSLIPFCVFHVIFIKILPLERSKDFIKLYHVSLLILLFLFLI